MEEPVSAVGVGSEPPRLRAMAPDRVHLTEQQLRTLRELRAVVLDLQSLLDDIRSGNTTLTTYESYVQEAKTEIDALLASIPSSKFDAETADAIRHLHNLWEQMSTNPLMQNAATFGSTGTSSTLQEQLLHLKVLDDICQRVLFQIGVLTIPPRLNDWLSLGRSGYYVPFHEVFAAEVPNFDDRMRVLRYLAWSPRVIRYGLVDVSTGLIYRYSVHAWSRLLSMLWIVLAVVAGTALVYGSAQLTNIPGWPLSPDNTSAMLSAWGALFGGVVVHMCITVAKRIQEQPQLPPALPIGDLPRYADAKLGQTLLKVALALIGLFGLVLSAGIAQATPLQAFLAGYSLDSVVELFGASIERRAASQIAGLRQQLGVSGDGS